LHQNIKGNLGLFEMLAENSPTVPPGDHDDEEEEATLTANQPPSKNLSKLAPK